MQKRHDTDPWASAAVRRLIRRAARRAAVAMAAAKLLGNSNTAPKGHGERDAEYLLTLYVQLQKGLQNQQG